MAIYCIAGGVAIWAGEINHMRMMPALIVLPGLDGTGTMHAHFFRAVGELFSSTQTIVYPSNQALDYAALEQIVRKQLPTDQAFVLLGESFSGPIAISIAAHPPQNLVGLVLSTTFARHPMAFARPVLLAMDRLPLQRIPIALYSGWLLGRWATPTLREALRQAISTVLPSVQNYRAACALNIDVTHLLSKISVPVLCLRATADRILFKSAVDTMSAGISNSRIVDIEGPHLLLQTAPDACAKTIAEFIESIDLVHDPAGSSRTEIHYSDN